VIPAPRVFLPALVALAGCSAGRDYVRPEVEIPAAWQQDSDAGESIANVPWFELFSDPVLVELIDTTLRENRDLRAAYARIDEAAASVGIVRAALFPRVDYGGAGTIDASSADDWKRNHAASGFLQASWQIDLWGRIRRSEEASLQTVLATEENARGLTLSLVAAVASSYVLLLDLDNRLSIAEKTVQVRRENLDLIAARFEGGSVSAVDLNQATVQLAEAEASIQAFTRSRQQVENSLSALMGRPPTSIPRGLPLSEQISAPAIPAGLPSELLARRPDVLAAERDLHAQTARIGVAEALKFPQFDLTASVSGVLANPDRGFFDIAAQLFGPLFNAGENRRRVEVEEARTLQLAARYEQTILNAWREVEDALVAVRTYEAEYAARRRQVAAATEAANLAWVRYDGGVTSYLEILETQRSLFSVQLQASEANQSWVTSIIQLYAVLGGGWYDDRADE